MNRKTFFASIFGALGVGRAQGLATPATPAKGKILVWQPSDHPEQTCFMDSDGKKDCRVMGAGHGAADWESGKALNNQCPTCRTMADSFHNPPLCAGMKGPVPCSPDERVTRCKRCNAAFWQDAE